MPYSPISCPDCGVTVERTSSSQKRCQTCGDAHRKAKNIEYLSGLRKAQGATPKGTVLTCVDCGVSFAYASGPQKRCSECQRKNEVSKIHEWLDANPARKAKYVRKAKDNYSFGGNRAAALERDAYKCQRCGATDDLHVHHMDGRGVTTPRDDRNNAMDNLQTLCRCCHSLTHHEERRIH